MREQWTDERFQIDRYGAWEHWVVDTEKDLIVLRFYASTDPRYDHGSDAVEACRLLNSAMGGTYVKDVSGLMMAKE